MREQIRCPSGGSAVGSSEQMVYAAKRDGADCALNSLGVELETAILEEAEKRVPSGQVVTDSIRGAAAGELGLEPRPNPTRRLAERRSGSADKAEGGRNIFGDQHVSQESRGCQALGDSARRSARCSIMCLHGFGSSASVDPAMAVGPAGQSIRLRAPERANRGRPRGGHREPRAGQSWYGRGRDSAGRRSVCTVPIRDWRTLCRAAAARARIVASIA
jgi:hypothetical protein